MKPLVKYILNIKNPWITSVKPDTKQLKNYVKLKFFFEMQKVLLKDTNIKNIINAQMCCP